MEIFREFTFEAAHRLTHVPEGTSAPACMATPTGSRSTWTGRSASRPAGSWISRTSRTRSRRFTTSSTTATSTRSTGLDNPTSENLARWIWERLAGELPLSTVVVRETCTSGCIYRGEAA